MTDEEMRRLAEAICTRPIGPNGFVGPESTHSGLEGARTAEALLKEFYEKATPMAILSLLDRVERAEAREREARRAALEEAAKVADRWTTQEFEGPAQAIRDLAKG